MKLTDGNIKRLNNKLLQWARREYPSVDGTIYAQIDEVRVFNLDGKCIEFIVRICRDGGIYLNKSFTIAITDGNINYIFGQIVGYIQACEEFGLDGNS